MIRICALNDYDSPGSDGPSDKYSATKEALEAEAHSIYNNALSLQIEGDVDQAEELFEELLDHDFLQEASKLVTEEECDNPGQPGLQLLYSTYKNLASMAYKKEDIHRAIQFYLKAVMIDETEVTVWYKIGTIALEIHNYQLASYAFQQGLKCNKNHWPCLDHVITALYVINDYWTCLKFIANALQKDAEYMKAVAFRDQIFSEQPSLKKESAPFFQACDPEVLSLHADKEEKDEYINEALEMRKIRRKLSYVPPSPPHSLPKPIFEFTWKCVGECLLVLYDEIVTSRPRKSMGLRVDLTPYVASESEEEEEEQTEEPDVQMAEGEEKPCPPSSQEGSAKVESMDISKGAEQTNTEAGDTQGNSGTSSPSVQMLSSPNPSNNNENGLIEMEDSSARKQGQKRRRNVPIEDVACKRRSARVRNTTRRKQEENVDVEELLLKFLPSSLLEVREEDEEGKTGDQNSEQEAGSSTGCSNETSDVVQLITATEEMDVEKFLKDSVENGGIIDLMGTYLVHLSELAHAKWSDGLVDVFLKVYHSVRKHLTLPSYLCSDEPADYIVEMGRMVLVSAELKLDYWLMKKARLKTSPANSRNRGSCSITLNQLEPNFPGRFYTEDLWHVSGLIGFSDIMAKHWAEHSVRVFWLKARFCMLQGQLEESIEYFDRALEYLQLAQENEGLSVVRLPNCRMDHVISVENIKLQQDSLRRYQSLEETQKLYDSEKYEKVVDLLLLTFTIPTAKGKMNVPRTTSAGLLEMGVAIPERHSQLLLLMDSLLRLKDYKRYVVWGEVSLNECLLNYRKSISHTVKDEWVAAMIQLFDGLDKAILTDPTSIEELTSACTMRLAKNLIKVIVDSLDVPEYATEMPISSVLPWKLLYHIIKNEERKLDLIQVLDESNKEILENSMSSSLMLLNVAHDYLGRHAWCTKSDGQLLLFFMKVLKTERARYPEDKPHAFKDELDQAFEQCVFCLYGYPTKKAKTRYLQDHNALQLDLNWESSQCLFEYFKPKTVPEFDSYKTSTVSGDLENLARRITLLVPKEKNPANTYESVLAYIEGHHNEPPSIPSDKPVTTPIVKELYYLLADYYFKNKEQAKAIKFYILDICVNPDRLDSWAGMSLARMSRLEQKLNSTELRMDQPIYKQAIASLRCFTRAVEIDCNNAKLWIEYGSLAYQLHSHASRQLKLMDWFPLSDELFQIATASKKEMLLIAANCYKKANECETEGGHNEEWLHFYMMGKVCEKMRTPPCEYLEHYKEAAEHLHEDYAAYPKKINYVVSPPHLAVESLELYYRQHVAILKELLYKKTEDLDLDYFEHYLREVAEGPFAHFREKKRTRKDCKDSPWTGTEDTAYSGLPSTVITTTITQTSVNITTTAAGQITPTTTAGQITPTTTAGQITPTTAAGQVTPTTAASQITPTTAAGQITPTTAAGQITPTTIAGQITPTTIAGQVTPTTAAGQVTPTTAAGQVTPTTAASQITPTTAAGQITPTTIAGQVTSTIVAGQITLTTAAGQITPTTAAGQITPTTAASQITPVTAAGQIIPATAANHMTPATAASQMSPAMVAGHMTPVMVAGQTSPTMAAGQLSPTMATSQMTPTTAAVHITPSTAAFRITPTAPATTTTTPHSTPPFAVSPTATKTSVSSATVSMTTTPTPASFSYARSNQDHNYFRQKSSDSSNHSALSEKPDDHAPNSDKAKAEDGSSKKDLPLSDIVGDSESGYKSTVSSDALRVTPPSKEMEAPPRLGRIDLSQPVFGLDDQFTTTVNQDYLNSTIDPNTITSQALDSLNALLESESFRTDDSDVYALDRDLTGNSSEEQQSRGSSDVAPQMGISDSSCSNKAVTSAVPVTNSVPASNNPVDSSIPDTTNPSQPRALPKSVSSEDEPSEISNEAVMDSVSSLSASNSNPGPAPPVNPKSRVQRHKELLDVVIGALHLCLSRFPTHYKALYRLAHLHFYHPFRKNVMYSRDILLGVTTSAWTNYAHLPAPGLFTDRKHSNFFQGVWRIPIEEVDRSGSFASHMNRTVKLLLEVLRKQCDNQMLFQLHIQLSRTPEPGRKYLRDAERVCFSQLAYEYALDTIELQMEEVSEADRERQVKFLMEVYKVWYHGVNKVYLHVERTNDIFLDVFRVIMKNTIPIKTTTVEQLEQAIRFCQQQLSIGKPSQVPYQSSIPVMTDYQRHHHQQQQQQHHQQQHYNFHHQMSNQSSSSLGAGAGHTGSVGHGGLIAMSSSGVSGHVKPCDVVIVSEHGTMQTHHRNRQMEHAEYYGRSLHTNSVTVTSDDKLSISPPEKLTSDVQAKMSSLEPIDLTGGVNPDLGPMSHSNSYHSMLGMDGLEEDVDMAPVDPRKLIKPCTVKLAAIPRSLMHSNTLTIKPSPSTEDIKQRLKTALLNQSRHQTNDNRLLKSTSEPCSPSTLTPDILATHSQ